MRPNTNFGQLYYIVLISRQFPLQKTVYCQKANVCSSTTITLLHRAQMYSRRHSPEDALQSSEIAFRAANMITAIVKALTSHDELARCPGVM